MGTNKKKASVLDVLFGNGSISGNEYRVIHFNTAIATTKNGEEPIAILVYGNDSGVFTTSAPLASLLFQVKDDVLFPMVKILKNGFMGAGTRIEILLPRGYSFMPVPASVQMQIVKESVEEEASKNAGAVAAPSFPKRNDKVSVGEVNEQDEAMLDLCENETVEYDSGADRRDSDVDHVVEDILSETADPSETEGGSADAYPVMQKDEKAQQSDVCDGLLDDDRAFLHGFDQDALNDKINRFLERHDEAERKKAACSAEKKEAETLDALKKADEEDFLARIAKAESSFA